ncbi:uncharacterized protein LOC143229369 [Tachypleus tridentatus]|uniref:uncharacterized protein LOC143229369 n=1 Tax=Tachypleus tridentatus TaxID=6853 RepID=UPI003FD6BF54
MSNEDLIMLEQERVAEKEDATERSPLKLQLTTNNLPQPFVIIEEVMQTISAHNTSCHCSLKVTRKIHDVIHCCKRKMQQNQQTTLHALFIRSIEPTPSHNENDGHDLQDETDISTSTESPSFFFV